MERFVCKGQEIERLMQDAQEIIYLAGEHLKKRYSETYRMQTKGERDVVTEADYESESLILGELKKRYPAHGILSEEAGEYPMDSPYCWVVDPLDGTVNFSRSIPIFGVILCLLYEQKPLLGLHYLPLTNDLYSAVSGQGAWHNGKKMRVSTRKLPQEVIAGLGDFNIGPDPASKALDNQLLMQALHTLTPSLMRTKIMGAACFDLALLASGALDLLIYPCSNPWDVLAGQLLVEEAGGRVRRQDNLLVFSNGCLEEDFFKDWC